MPAGPEDEGFFATSFCIPGYLRGQTVSPWVSGHPQLPPALLLPQQQATPLPGDCAAREDGPAASARLSASASQTAPSGGPR